MSQLFDFENKDEMIGKEDHERRVYWHHYFDTEFPILDHATKDGFIVGVGKARIVDIDELIEHDYNHLIYISFVNNTKPNETLWITRQMAAQLLAAMKHIIEPYSLKMYFVRRADADWSLLTQVKDGQVSSVVMRLIFGQKRIKVQPTIISSGAYIGFTVTYEQLNDENKWTVVAVSRVRVSTFKLFVSQIEKMLQYATFYQYLSKINDFAGVFMDSVSSLKEVTKDIVDLKERITKLEDTVNNGFINKLIDKLLNNAKNNTPSTQNIDNNNTFLGHDVKVELSDEMHNREWHELVDDELNDVNDTSFSSALFDRLYVHKKRTSMYDRVKYWKDVIVVKDFYDHYNWSKVGDAIYDMGFHSDGAAILHLLMKIIPCPEKPDDWFIKVKEQKPAFDVEKLFIEEFKGVDKKSAEEITNLDIMKFMYYKGMIAANVYVEADWSNVPVDTEAPESIVVDEEPQKMSRIEDEARGSVSREIIQQRREREERVQQQMDAIIMLNEKANKKSELDKLREKQIEEQLKNDPMLLKEQGKLEQLTKQTEQPVGESEDQKTEQPVEKPKRKRGRPKKKKTPDDSKPQQKKERKTRRKRKVIELPVEQVEPVEQVQEEPIKQEEIVEQVQEEPVKQTKPVEQVQEEPVEQVQEEPVKQDNVIDGIDAQDIENVKRILEDITGRKVGDLKPNDTSPVDAVAITADDFDKVAEYLADHQEIEPLVDEDDTQNATEREDHEQKPNEEMVSEELAEQQKTKPEESEEQEVPETEEPSKSKETEIPETEEPSKSEEAETVEAGAAENSGIERDANGRIKPKLFVDPSAKDIIERTEKKNPVDIEQLGVYAKYGRLLAGEEVRLYQLDDKDECHNRDYIVFSDIYHRDAQLYYLYDKYVYMKPMYKIDPLYASEITAYNMIDLSAIIKQYIDLKQVEKLRNSLYAHRLNVIFDPNVIVDVVFGHYKIGSPMTSIFLGIAWTAWLYEKTDSFRDDNDRINAMIERFSRNDPLKTPDILSDNDLYGWVKYYEPLAKAYAGYDKSMTLAQQPPLFMTPQQYALDKRVMLDNYQYSKVDIDLSSLDVRELQYFFYAVYDSYIIHFVAKPGYDMMGGFKDYVFLGERVLKQLKEQSHYVLIGLIRNIIDAAEKSKKTKYIHQIAIYKMFKNYLDTVSLYYKHDDVAKCKQILFAYLAYLNRLQLQGQVKEGIEYRPFYPKSSEVEVMFPST